MHNVSQKRNFSKKQFRDIHYQKRDMWVCNLEDIPQNLILWKPFANKLPRKILIHSVMSNAKGSGKESIQRKCSQGTIKQTTE
jgi:hypothetical protein